MDNSKDSKREKEPVSIEHLPHKFCPNCGFRNEASMDACEQCGKDISWIRIPEPIPPSEIIKEKPRSEPEREPIFSMRAILVFLLIFLLLVALIAVMIVVGKSKDDETGHPADSGDAIGRMSYAENYIVTTCALSTRYDCGRLSTA
ncbi:MAG: hypothetical protein JW738_00495 [Actinobacteria bacterium]|nr:hypothetical protein [Actinomycetota bacterium]